MNIESILRKTVSYEDWMIERLQNEQEVGLYIEACLDVFRDDGDLDGLLSAFELVLRAQHRSDLRPSPPVIGLNDSYPALTNFPDSDNLPATPFDGWPPAMPEETLNYPRQSDSLASSYPHLTHAKPKWYEEERDDSDTAMARLNQLHFESRLSISTWGSSTRRKDLTLER